MSDVPWILFVASGRADAARYERLTRDVARTRLVSSWTEAITQLATDVQWVAIVVLATFGSSEEASAFQLASRRRSVKAPVLWVVDSPTREAVDAAFEAGWTLATPSASDHGITAFLSEALTRRHQLHDALGRTTAACVREFRLSPAEAQVLTAALLRHDHVDDVMRARGITRSSHAEIVTRALRKTGARTLEKLVIDLFRRALAG